MDSQTDGRSTDADHHPSNNVRGMVYYIKVLWFYTSAKRLIDTITASLKDLWRKGLKANGTAVKLHQPIRMNTLELMGYYISRRVKSHQPDYL